MRALQHSFNHHRVRWPATGDAGLLCFGTAWSAVTTCRPEAHQVQ